MMFILQPVHSTAGVAHELSMRFKGVELLAPSKDYVSWEISSSTICLYGIMMASGQIMMNTLSEVITEKCPNAPVLLDSPPGLKVTLTLFVMHDACP